MESPPLQSGFPLLVQQYRALLLKNVLLSLRNWRSSFVQLSSSFFFIFLLFCIQKSVDSRFRSSSAFRRDVDPKPLVAPPIPPCEDMDYIKLPCFDFVWSGDESARIGEIVRKIRENNPGRPIPQEKVKAFRTPSDVDKWLASNIMLCPGALHFVDRNASGISYGLQTNSTPVERRGNYADPTFKIQIPLQLAAEREIARDLLQDPNFSWTVSFKEFAHPAFEIISAIGELGPTLLLASAMFTFVMQISGLVMERELKLRQAMTMMGLYDIAYWLSWITWEGILTLISSLLTVLFGMIFQFDFFRRNSFAIVFLLFFLFQLDMTGFGFMLSAFISKSSSATTLGFFFYVVGFLTQYVTATGLPYNPMVPKKYQFMWSLFPPNIFAQGLTMLSGATHTPQDPGISWDGRKQCAPNDDGCSLTINDLYVWLVATSFIWFALAICLDNILPKLYFLNPFYWAGKGGGDNKEEGNTVAHDENVQEEESTVKQQTWEDAGVAVQIRGLKKTYAGTRKFACCCKCKKIPPYHAVKGVWMNIPKDQLFCLLGPNGAGKTTIISCLTGIADVTDGDALVHGYSVRNSTGMSNIRRVIGVCPQFDILWDAMSGEEHLHLFATIKGLPSHSVKEIMQKLLGEVKLTEAARVRAGSYSGGMRRRLSVAIALIGDPKLVILDEPTTGVDPVTRRHIWDVIEEAKRDRAIILTTHSMEEADILSDRIAIVAKGRLRCIGTSIMLKSKFGSGFITNVSFSGEGDDTPDRRNPSSHHEAVKKFFKFRLDISPKEENKSFLTFVIPREKEKLLKNFFAELQERESEFGISDIQVGLTTLEEVFLNIAKQAELESAAAEGKFAELELDSGIFIQVPVGARFIGIPVTESAEKNRVNMIEVYWEQDDTGSLCISGHSPKIPLPPHVSLGTGGGTKQSSPTQKQEVLQGIVIDPSQLTDSDLQLFGSKKYRD